MSYAIYMVTGINHITLSVRSLAESVGFYTQLLGFRARLRWPEGAYLTAGSLWLALALDAKLRAGPLPEYTHIALTVELHAFPQLCARLRQASVVEWQPNTSEGSSIYFLDPNGHKLEVHCGDLESRLADAKHRRWANFDGLA